MNNSKEFELLNREDGYSNIYLEAQEIGVPIVNKNGNLYSVEKVLRDIFNKWDSIPTEHLYAISFAILNACIDGFREVANDWEIEDESE